MTTERNGMTARFIRTIAAGFAVVIIGLSCAGCLGRHTIEEGLWELSFDIVKKSSTDRVKPQRIQEGPFQVEVSVEYDAGLETVTVWYTDETPRDLPAREDNFLTGTIKPSERTGRPEINLITPGGDAAGWDFRMFAAVRSPIELKGALFGRLTATEDIYSEGKWEMRKIPDEQWVGHRR